MAWDSPARRQENDHGGPAEPDRRPVPEVVRPAFALARCDFDEVPRLAAFRAAHPEVTIGDAEFGVWEARIPEENAEQIVNRHTLRELLDRLDGLYPPDG